MFIIILMFTIRKLDEVPKTIALILLDPESRCQGRNHRRAYSCSILPITVYGNCWCSHIALLVFFFCILFFFNWRTSALQYCFGLCHTSTWISHRYTYVLSLSVFTTICISVFFIISYMISNMQRSCVQKQNTSSNNSHAPLLLNKSPLPLTTSLFPSTF